MRHTAACVSGSIERRDDISARFPRATGWLYNQGILFAIVLIAFLSALSGCGSGESDVGQTNGNSVTTVTGTVTNAGTGAPLADATVAATGFSTTTDSNGNFTLTGVPPGPQTLTVSRSGFISTTKTVTVVAGKTVSTGTITLTPRTTFGTIIGTVTNAGTGAPLSGATVAVASIGVTATTDTNGNFTLAGVPSGPGEPLSVTASGFSPETKVVTVVGGEIVSADTIALLPVILIR